MTITRYIETDIPGFFWEVEIEGSMVDNGIGPYEYWGAKGVDTRIEPEIENITRRLIREGANPNGVRDAADAWEDYESTEEESERWLEGLAEEAESEAEDYEASRAEARAGD
jgi:hypothetical protein